MSVTTITKKFYIDGVLTNPTSIVLSDPTGTYGVKRTDNDDVVVADGTAMTKISTGIYQYTFEDPASDLSYECWVEIVYGGETYHFEEMVQGGSGLVLPADNALITLAEIKRWLKLSGTDADRDDFLQEAINEWSDTIEKRLGRVIKSAEHTDERHDGGKLAILPKNIPVTAISSIKVDGAALGSSDYTLDREGSIIRLVSGKPFGGGPGSVLVTYTGGYSAVPGDLKRAVIQIVAIEHYLSGHGRRAIAKRGESTAEGNVTYERGPVDQEKIIEKLERKYARR